MGKVKGNKGGMPVTAKKKWLIDTGAQISVITKQNGDKFDLTVIGGSASGTTGGAGIIIKSGLTMIFKIFDRSGKSKSVNCSLDVGVKSNNAGSEILGMDQITSVGAVVEWDPTARTGGLRAR